MTPLIDAANAAVAELRRLSGSESVIYDLERQIHEAQFHEQFESAPVPEDMFPTALCCGCGDKLPDGWESNLCRECRP